VGEQEPTPPSADVELDVVGAQLRSKGERLQRVGRRDLARAGMTDALHLEVLPEAGRFRRESRAPGRYPAR
jgi:hypothetical protein